MKSPINKNTRKRITIAYNDNDVIFNHLLIKGLRISITITFHFINRDIGSTHYRFNYLKSGQLTVIVLADVTYRRYQNKASALLTCDQSDVCQLLLVQIALHDS